MLGLSPLTPAYGRDYKSKKALEEDFNNNEDFQTPEYTYVNKEDLMQMGIKSIQVRYGNLRKTTVIKIK